MIWPGNGKQFNGYAKIVQILGSDDSRRPRFHFVSMRSIVISDEEQAPGRKIGGLCGEDLVGTEQHIGHRYFLLGRLEEILGLFLVFDKGAESLNI